MDRLAKIHTNDLVYALVGALVLCPIMHLKGAKDLTLFLFGVIPESFYFMSVCVVCMVFGGFAGFFYSRKERIISNLMDELNELNVRIASKSLAQAEELLFTKKVGIDLLIAASEYHDNETVQHAYRVAEYVLVLCNAMIKLGHHAEYISRTDYVLEMRNAALLHDVGKVAVPASIINYPGKLSEAEFDIMKNHTTAGGSLLEKANREFKDRFCKDSWLALARDIAFYHHEKYNGTGYPRGLKGEQIPLSARITALADVYDALTSKRPYKDPWPPEQIKEEIKNLSGKHFDPLVVEAFLSVEPRFQEIAATYRCQEALNTRS